MIGSKVIDFKRNLVYESLKQEQGNHISLTIILACLLLRQVS